MRVLLALLLVAAAPALKHNAADTKAAQARKFLEHNDKVQITVSFRGREMQHQEDDDRHPDQHRHQQQEPAGEVSPHLSEIVSTRRSKLGWSLNPCTRLAWAAVWISWSMKIHGGSSIRIRCASR